MSCIQLAVRRYVDIRYRMFHFSINKVAALVDVTVVSGVAVVNLLYWLPKKITS